MCVCRPMAVYLLRFSFEVNIFLISPSFPSPPSPSFFSLLLLILHFFFEMKTYFFFLLWEETGKPRSSHNKNNSRPFSLKRKLSLKTQVTWGGVPTYLRKIGIHCSVYSVTHEPVRVWLYTIKVNRLQAIFEVILCSVIFLSCGSFGSTFYVSSSTYVNFPSLFDLGQRTNFPFE